MRDEPVETFVYRQFLDHVIGTLGSLAVQYQPVVDLTNGRIEYYEALLRISSSQYGALYPASFLLLMDQLGVMKETTHWMIDHVMTELRADARVFVNLAPEFIGDQRVIDYSLAALERSGADPGRIGFEVAHGSLFRRGREAVEWLAAVQAAGIPVTVDRCSHIDILRPEMTKLPVNYAKLTLTPGATILDDDMVEIAVATARLADSGKQAIALGIEDEQALDAVKRAGFGYGQGFLLGYPAAYDDLTAPAAE